MNILIILFVIFFIIFFFNKKTNNENFILKENMELINTNTNNNCMMNINRYKLIKNDLENMIFNFKKCSVKDPDYNSIKPYKNDCKSSPYNERWITNLNVQKCALDIDKKLISLKKKHNLTDDEFNIIKDWKKLKCLNNLPLKFSEAEYSKKFNCENDCEYKKFVCKNIIDDVKNKINIYNVCSCKKEESCNNQPSKHEYNDNVEKNLKIKECKEKVKKWILDKYKYWGLDENNRIRNYLNSWENVESVEKFFNELDNNKCKLLTRCN
jgi:hypothetical protein